jgi:hypothetical protein
MIAAIRLLAVGILLETVGTALGVVGSQHIDIVGQFIIRHVSRGEDLIDSSTDCVILGAHFDFFIHFLDINEGNYAMSLMILFDTLFTHVGSYRATFIEANSLDGLICV